MNVQVDDGVLNEFLQQHNDDECSRQAASSLVGAIDQGTSSTRFVVFTHLGRIAASAQMEHRQIFPPGADKVGWHEHDPIEIWRNTVQCIEATVTALAQHGIDIQHNVESTTDTNTTTNNQAPSPPLRSFPLKAVGLTNQRETTVAWNAATGVPYANAIVWDDVRTTRIAHDIARGNVNRLRDATGLPLASYFAGTKVRWLLEHNEALQADLNHPDRQSLVRFGTIDTWLMYQLTGTASSAAPAAANCGGLFVTDVSNASRWLFLNLHTTSWDQELIDTVCAPFTIPKDTALPRVCPSSHVYATCRGKECGVPALDQVPLAAVLGDQQAALFGQCALAPGEAKNTYGTGLFLMMNTGTRIIPSRHGLLTTVAYQIGQQGDIHYALEGSVSHSGSTIQWLRDQLKLIGSAAESETLARTTTQNDGLYLVPAFGGLFAPHWRSDARACLVGLTASHHRGHVCRAALEAAAYQTKEVFDAMIQDAAEGHATADAPGVGGGGGVTLQSLKVDGGATANRLLMQFQADMLQVPVIQPKVMETTSLGAALAAGLAVGVWQHVDDLRALWAVSETFTPNMDNQQRHVYWQGWNKAISKSMGWIDDDDDDEKFVDAHGSSSFLIPLEEEQGGEGGGERIGITNTGKITATTTTTNVVATTNDSSSSSSSPQKEHREAPPTSCSGSSRHGWDALALASVAAAAMVVGFVLGRQQQHSRR